jgi:hypothetical protein
MGGNAQPLYNEVFQFTRGQKHKRGDLFDVYSETLEEITLRDKVHEKYVKFVHGDILKN